MLSKMLSKKLSLATLAALAAAASAAQAQSSVELFGRLDIGVSTINNVGGSRFTEVSSSVTTPSFLGFRGTEDLGGGLRAFFMLQHVFDVDTGSQQAALAGFASNAYVGLSGPDWGSLSFGRQKDFTLDMAIQRFDASLDVGGIHALRGGPFGKLNLPLNANGANWDRLGGFALSNTLKYVSPSWGGFTAGVLYGLGEATDSQTRNDARSLHARYASGGFGAGVAYTRVKFPSVNSGDNGAAITNAGARYTLGDWRFNGLYSKTSNTFSRAAVQAVELGVLHTIAPWTWGASVQRMRGNAQLDNNRATQLAAQASYHLSKRTYVYAMAVGQQANDRAKATINRVAPSSTDRQTLLRVGITTSF